MNPHDGKIRKVLSFNRRGGKRGHILTRYLPFFCFLNYRKYLFSAYTPNHFRSVSESPESLPLPTQTT